MVLRAGATAASTNTATAASWVNLINSGLADVLTHRAEPPDGFATMVGNQLTVPSYTPGLIAVADLMSGELRAPDGAVEQLALAATPPDESTEAGAVPGERREYWVRTSAQCVLRDVPLVEDEAAVSGVRRRGRKW